MGIGGIIGVVVGGLAGVCVMSLAFGADGRDGLALIGSLLGGVIGIGVVRRISDRAK